MRARLARSLGVVVFGLAIYGCGSGYSSGSPAAPTPSTGTTGQAAVVTIPLSTDAYGESMDPQFSPGSVTVTAGTTLTWQNKDGIAHTTSSDGGAWSAALPSGGSYSYTFATKGNFSYHCTIHPGMKGTVTVQ